MEFLYETIGQGLKNRCSLSPDALAVLDEDILYSWTDINRMSDEASQQFFSMGIRKGTNVGLLGVNSVRWISTFFGLCKLGAIPFLINICFQEAELTDVLKNGGIEILMYGKSFKNIDYRRLIDNLDMSRFGTLRKILSFEDVAFLQDAPTNPDAQSVDLEQRANADFLSEQDPYDCAAVLYTSGTTGSQKGVMLSHFSLINNAREHVRSMRWTTDDKICLCVPLMHCFGTTACLLSALYSGASLQIISYYSSEKVLATIEKYSCTVLNGVPSMFLALIHNKNFKNYHIGSLKSGVIAGSHIEKQDFKEIKESLKIEKLQIAYGQTETSPCVSIMPYDEQEKASDSSGRVIEGVQVKIQNIRSSDRPCHADEKNGEILVKGYNVMLGYYNMPELTKKAFTDDGWLKTGDSGYIDADGYLHITGRIKDIIIRGGENVSAREIENCISEMGGIKYIKVIGIPEKVIQEKIVACICKHDARIDEDAVKNHVLSRLAKYKVPEHVCFFDSFPFTASGKIDCKKLREMAFENLKQQGSES